jgi:hypothetical protein
VLAYAYSIDDSTSTLELSIYDPDTRIRPPTM